MIFIKISHNFIKSPLKICLISQISVHSLWHVCRHQNLVPWSCLPLTCGYIHVLNHEKKMYKIRLQRDFLELATNDQCDKRFLLTSKFCPLELSVPDLRLYTLLNHEKMCIKSEVEEILFFYNLQQMTIVMRPSC